MCTCVIHFIIANALISMRLLHNLSNREQSIFANCNNLPALASLSYDTIWVPDQSESRLCREFWYFSQFQLWLTVVLWTSQHELLGMPSGYSWSSGISYRPCIFCSLQHPCLSFFHLLIQSKIQKFPHCFLDCDCDLCGWTWFGVAKHYCLSKSITTDIVILFLRALRDHMWERWDSLVVKNTNAPIVISGFE